MVATAPTVYGIETLLLQKIRMDHMPLQQYLPFTVLKHTQYKQCIFKMAFLLQQHLPFTVLKLYIYIALI